MQRAEASDVVVEHRQHEQLVRHGIPLSHPGQREKAGHWAGRKGPGPGGGRLKGQRVETTLRQRGRLGSQCGAQHAGAAAGSGTRVREMYSHRQQAHMRATWCRRTGVSARPPRSRARIPTLARRRQACSRRPLREQGCVEAAPASTCFVTK